MSKKINLSQSQKDQLKKDFNSLRKADLKGEELRYYTLIQNGKNSAKKNVRFEGKYLAGRIVNIATVTAKKQHIPLEKYLDENRESVRALIESGFVLANVNPDALIKTIEERTQKHVSVNDGNGISRVDRATAIEALAMLKQFAASNTTIVYMELPTKYYLDNKIEISVPFPEQYEDMTGEEFIEFLDNFGTDYIQSDSTTNA
jgi:hypothetical protein